MISNKYIFINDNDKYCCVCFETFNLIKRTKQYYTQYISNEFNDSDSQNTEIDLNKLINKYINDFDKEIALNTNNTNEDNLIQEMYDNTKGEFYDNTIEEISDNTTQEICNMIQEISDNMIEEVSDNMIEEIVNDIIEEKLESDGYLSLNDIDKYIFLDNKIPNELLVKSCCNIHYICIRCIRKIINNYDNHPINENNSHMACPYPFKDCVTNIGFKNVFNHNLISKICNTEDEWDNYLEHSNRYAFPGYTIIKCPIYNYRTDSKCNTDILVENIILKSANKGELVLECSQNNLCLKKFCYCCKEVIYNYYSICYTCKTNYENENPNVYNYYFNKNSNLKMDEITNEITNRITNEITNEITNTNETDSENTNSTIVEDKKTYDESSYLFKNSEITLEEAVRQMLMLLENINNYMICSICKNSLYKTEKCNALSHHNLERCYACGRIGFLIKGLGDHWNVAGISGCYRFDHDSFIKNYVSEYKCTEYCSSHEKGDCIINDHLNGIEMLNKTRIKSCLFHAINSLLPELRFNVYDDLYNYLKKNKEEYIEFLPFKQTLILTSVYKERSRDYSEQIIYEQLKCEYPGNIEEFKLDKSLYIDVQLYLDKYLLNKNLKSEQNNSDESLIIYNNDNLNTETNIRIDTNIENANFTDNIFRSLVNIDTDNFFVNINEIMEQERMSRRFYVPEISLYNNMEIIDEINVNQNETSENDINVNQNETTENETTENDINEIMESDITDEIIVYNGRSIRRNNN